MARGKYIREYRVREYLDARGRIRSETEYIGPLFCFACSEAERKKGRRILLALCAAGWAACVGALALNTTAMRTWFVSVPFAFVLLCLGLQTERLVSLGGVGERLEHRQAEKFSRKLPGAFLAEGILGTHAAAAAVLLQLTGKASGWQEVLFSVLALASGACGIGGFCCREIFGVRETEKPDRPA